MIRIKATYLILLLWVIARPLANSQPGSPDGLTYKTGWGSTVKLGIELQKNLAPVYRKQVHVKPINIETDVMPFIHPEEISNPSLPGPAMASVFISAGFIDLVNNVAHAKAIDKVQKGYFEKYVLSLADENGEMELRPLPNLENKKYWTDDMMNEQLSNFNQMVGEVVSLNLAHYYLGHYKKYADRLKDAEGKPVPINTLLTPAEWEEAVKCGVKNSLSCGLGIDGVNALYDCIDKMPKRPAWTLYFLPANVKVAKLKKDMEKMEKKFFANRE